MVTEPEIHLTTKDHAILQSMLTEHGEAHDAFAQLLRQKLLACTVALASDVDPAIVRLGSRVTYRINGKSVGPLLLTEAAEAAEAPEMNVSADSNEKLAIDTIYGLALLGLAEGAAITLNIGDGVTQSLEVVGVLSATQTDMNSPQSSHAAPAGRKTGAVLHFRPRAAVARHSRADDDDPGPSAA